MIQCIQWISLTFGLTSITYWFTTLRFVKWLQVKFKALKFCILYHYHFIIKRWIYHKHVFYQYYFAAFIPFVMIVSFNVKTFVIINRRQKLSPRLHNTRSQVLNHQAAKQSYVLLAILVVFGFCHIPRFVLGKSI